MSPYCICDAVTVWGKNKIWDRALQPINCCARKLSTSLHLSTHIVHTPAGQKDEDNHKGIHVTTLIGCNY